MQKTPTDTATAQPWVAGLLLLTALVYLPGLAGPFLFDDSPNIVAPLQAWIDGRMEWRQLVFGNGAGPLGRPLSMLSFLGNAAAAGIEPLSFKITNLAIHMLCGGLLFALLTCLLARDRVLAPHAHLTAVATTALWLLHPIQVSTVLYVVQRMAQLSALFALAALLAFVISRVALEAGRRRQGLAGLFLTVPLATAAAALSKENGILVPLLCAIIELGYFRATALVPRPREVKGFFLLFLVLPAIAVIVYFSMQPDRLVGGYDVRLFTLGERLLSEPRALMSYIDTLLLPSGPMLGIYTDDFAISRGVLDPPATLFAVLGLIALIVAAVLARNRIPAFFTGIGLFLAAHSMESSVFPLELYFEHRNYLPAAGFFLAVSGLVGWVSSRRLLDAKNARARRLLVVGGLALVLVLGLATLARTIVWRSFEQLAEQGVREHPQSLRAQIDFANVLNVQGRHAEMQAVFDHMLTMDNPAARHSGAINGIGLRCAMTRAIDSVSVQRIEAIAGSKLELPAMQGFEALGKELQRQPCDGLAVSDLARIIDHVVDAAPQPPTVRALWRSRHVAATLHAASGNLPAAIEQASMAWQSGVADSGIGIYLANLNLLNGDARNAQRALDEAQAKIATWDSENRRIAGVLRQRINNGTHDNAAAPHAPSTIPSGG